MDGGEDHRDIATEGRSGSMKQLKKPIKSLEALQELGRKCGVQVTDMAERGIRAIGILGGVRRQDQVPGRRGAGLWLSDCDQQ